MPSPASVPIAAEHHNVTAVFRPVMFSPLRKITPAPRKPMPKTTIRDTKTVFGGSSGEFCKHDKHCGTSSDHGVRA
jgi:hypothetical protein